MGCLPVCDHILVDMKEIEGKVRFIILPLLVLTTCTPFPEAV